MSNEREFVIEVAGKTINLEEKGRNQLLRLTLISEFFSKYGRSFIRSLDEQAVDFDNLNTAGLLALIVDFLGTLDEQAYILLGRIVSAESSEFVEENFDLEWVIEGLEKLVKVPVFRKTVLRFFGNAE